MTRVQVEEMVAFKKSKIYRMIGDGNFPPAMTYCGAKRWKQSQVQYFIENGSWSESDWRASKIKTA